MVDFKLILIYILKYFKESNIGFGKTRLLKLAYLVELFYYRKNMKRLTEEEWIFYKYGPYLMNYDDILSDSSLFSIYENDDFSKITLNDNVSYPELSNEIQRLIKHTIKEFGDLDFYKLLDYIYYDTEPMQEVQNRLEKLDFNSVKSEEFYKIKEFKNLNNLLENLNSKYKEKIRNASKI